MTKIFWTTVSKEISLLQNNLVGVGQYTLLCLKTIKAIAKGRFDLTQTFDQMFESGVMSLPVVAITGFSTGLVLAAQSFFQLSDKGLTEATGIMVAKAMATELGPILTAFMVTGRVGASMCAEIGTMKVTEQIDALRSMGVNPIEYLIAPRLIAGLSMMPLLTIFSNAMGLVGAYLVSVYVFGMSESSFLNPIPINMRAYDITCGLAKSFIFSFLIVTICCYKGMITHSGAAGVGKSITQSVVISYSLILLVNFMMTLFMNYLYIYIYG
jgi:phospholipid/cholesterol/gamma-HCH transport system permease protein